LEITRNIRVGQVLNIKIRLREKIHLTLRNAVDLRTFAVTKSNIFWHGTKAGVTDEKKSFRIQLHPGDGKRFVMEGKDDSALIQS
jgi:hypothetical protein